MNRIVVVTGGTSGIGKSCAELFSAAGDTVIVLGRTNENSPNFMKCDVSNEQEVKDVFGKINDTYKRIDILINSAGFGVSGAIELVDVSEIKKLFDVNVFGIINCYKEALKSMQSGAKILNISSVCGLFPLPYRGLYCASKSAVNMLSYSMAMELKASKIQVCAICPGDTKTNFTKNRIKVFDTNNRYGDRITIAASGIDSKEEKRMTANFVAKKIFIQANKNTMKPVLIIGKKYKLLSFLSKIFPVKWINSVIEKMFGGHKK